MKVRLFGGPADGKEVDLHRNVWLYEVPVIDPNRPGISRGQYERIGDVALYAGLAPPIPTLDEDDGA